MGKDKKFAENDLVLKGFKQNPDGTWSKPGASMEDVRRIAQGKPEKRKSKYGVSDASERTHEGTTYMSKLEMNYRKHLDLLMTAERACDRVFSYKEQVPYEIKVNGKKICNYILDFEVKRLGNVTEYIDVKGISTPVYKLKKKLIEALYNIKITEIKRGDF